MIKTRNPFPDPWQSDTPRSQFLAIFAPGAAIAVILARQFALPIEWVSAGLMIPLTCLMVLYIVNWLMDLWQMAFERDLRKRVMADTPGQTMQAKLGLTRRPRGYMVVAITALLVVVAAFFMLLFQIRASMLTTLSVLIILVCLLALMRGRLPLSALTKAANRATIGSANLAAMLLAAFAFHSIFMALGGADMINTLTTRLIPRLDDPWLLLVVFCLGLMLIGTVLDWLTLSVVILPLLMPLVMSIVAMIDPSELTGPVGALQLHAQGSVSQGYQVRLWVLALIWMALATSIVTYVRQNGEITQKGLALSSGNAQDAPLSARLFLVLQIIGLGIVMIMPQSVLWLPAYLMR